MGIRQRSVQYLSNIGQKKPRLLRGGAGGSWIPTAWPVRDRRARLWRQRGKVSSSLIFFLEQAGDVGKEGSHQLFSCVSMQSVKSTII